MSLKYNTGDESYSARWQARWKFMRAVLITCIIPVLFSQSQTWNESLKKPENHPRSCQSFQLSKNTTYYTNKEQSGIDTQL